MSQTLLSSPLSPLLPREHAPIEIPAKPPLTYIPGEAKIITPDGTYKALSKPDDTLMRLLLPNAGRVMNVAVLRSNMKDMGITFDWSYVIRLNESLKIFTREDLVIRPFEGHLRLGHPLWKPETTLTLPELELRLDTEALVLQRGEQRIGQLDFEETKLMITLMTPKDGRLTRLLLEGYNGKTASSNRNDALNINRIIGYPPLIFTQTRGEQHAASLRDPSHVSLPKFPSN